MTKDEIILSIDKALSKAHTAKGEEMAGMSPSKEKDMIEAGFNGAIAALTLLREGIADAG